MVRPVVVTQGTPAGETVDFSKFTVPRLILFKFKGLASACRGCGATALSMLTSIAPEVIAEENGRRHYSDGFMLKFLRRRNYTIVPVTKSNVPSGVSNIGAHNVVLISQLLPSKSEGTWGIIFNHNYYHNYEVYSLDPLSFLNKPILSAYVIWNPLWPVLSDFVDTLSEKDKRNALSISGSLSAGKCRPFFIAPPLSQAFSHP